MTCLVLTCAASQLWGTHIGGIATAVASAATWAWQLLHTPSVQAALDWVLWTASFGMLSTGAASSAPVRATYGAVAAPPQPADDTPSLSTLFWATLFLVTQVASAWVKYSMMTSTCASSAAARLAAVLTRKHVAAAARRQIYGVAIHALRTLLSPGIVLRVVAEAILGAVTMATLMLTLGSPRLWVTCSSAVTTPSVCVRRADVW